MATSITGLDIPEDYTTPVYVPGKTYFTDEEIANYIAWGRANDKPLSNVKWSVAYIMNDPQNYPDFPPLVLDNNGDVVNTEYWIEVGEGTHVPRVQHERNQLMRDDRDEWESTYITPYETSSSPSPTPSPTPTPTPTPGPSPTPTPSPTPSPTPTPFVKPAAVSHKSGQPPAVTKIGPAPSTFTSIR